MSSPSQFRIRPAVQADFAACRRLTFNALAPMLEAGCADQDEGSRVTALVAEMDAPVDLGLPPIGLALVAPVFGYPSELQLYSLVVESSWRRRGVGRALLDALADHGRVGGARQLRAEWSDRLPGRDALSALLASAGWTEPRPVLLRVQSPVGHSPVVFGQRDAFLARAERNGLSITSWVDLDAEARSTVLAAAATLSEEGILPDWADPRNLSNLLDSPYTLVVRQPDGTPVGWIICQPQEELGRYMFPVGWVRPEFGRRGGMLIMLADVTDRMTRDLGPQAIAAFEAPCTIPGMWKLLEKQFLPHTHLPGVISDVMQLSCRHPE